MATVEQVFMMGDGQCVLCLHSANLCDIKDRPSGLSILLLLLDNLTIDMHLPSQFRPCQLTLIFSALSPFVTLIP